METVEQGLHPRDRDEILVDCTAAEDLIRDALAQDDPEQLAIAATIVTGNATGTALLRLDPDTHDELVMGDVEPRPELVERAIRQLRELADRSA